MAVKKRGLGRGLDALLGATRPATNNASATDVSDDDNVPADFTFETGMATSAPSAASGATLKHLPVDLLQRGKYQPRLDMHPESLQELADSISAQGVVQPIVVRPIGGGRYEIIAGERRWRAAQLAGLQEMPVVIRDVSDQAAMAMALIENIQRENLNALEQANALQRLTEEFGLTHQQAADAVGRSRTAVTNLLRLLELEDEVKEMIGLGELEMGHARALLALTGNAQREAARKVAAQGLSVRETERLVKHLLKAPAAPKRRSIDPDVRRLQNDLSERLGAGVTIEHGAKGRGKLVIQYNNLDQLDGILERIK
jgi:ParB family chromosome partitioning protein